MFRTAADKPYETDGTAPRSASTDTGDLLDTMKSEWQWLSNQTRTTTHACSNRRRGRAERDRVCILNKRIVNEPYLGPRLVPTYPFPGNELSPSDEIWKVERTAAPRTLVNSWTIVSPSSSTLSNPRFRDAKEAQAHISSEQNMYSFVPPTPTRT